MIENKNLVFRWLKFLFLIIITLGIVFRFTNLDRKIYWYDEIFTSLRVSGYRANEAEKQMSERVVSFEEIQKFQYPNLEKTAFNTIKGLAVEEPQLPPLYFLLTQGKRI
jgi:uncharacterized membrane protein